MPIGTPIHADVLDHSDVKRFAEVAEKVCEIFERMDDLSEVEFLVGLKEMLSLAYSLAQRLPDPYDWPDDDEDDAEASDEELESVRAPEGMSEAENSERFWGFYRRIGDHSHVVFVFDPTETNQRDVVDGELAEMLAGLYVELKDGLMLCDRSSDEERAQALWDWRFGGTQGWGARFAHAFLPMHSLLQHHYDAIGEEWWANYKDEEGEE